MYRARAPRGEHPTQELPKGGAARAIAVAPCSLITQRTRLLRLPCQRAIEGVIEANVRHDVACVSPSAGHRGNSQRAPNECHAISPCRQRPGIAEQARRPRVARCNRRLGTTTLNQTRRTALPSELRRDTHAVRRSSPPSITVPRLTQTPRPSTWPYSTRAPSRLRATGLPRQLRPV